MFSENWADFRGTRFSLGNVLKKCFRKITWVGKLVLRLKKSKTRYKLLQKPEWTMRRMRSKDMEKGNIQKML